MFRIFQLFGENLKVFLNLTAAVTSRKTTEHTCELVNRYRRHLVDLPLKQVRFTTIIRVDHSGKNVMEITEKTAPWQCICCY